MTVFAYGSNMSLGRIRARLASVTVLAVGSLPGRRIAFHKRGRDGSGKADAQIGGPEDRLWGVLMSIAQAEKASLDRFETGYDDQSVSVETVDGRVVSARIYVARPETIDIGLRPYCWFHRFVTHGAKEHDLPAEYVRHLMAFEPLDDPDKTRATRNRKLLE